MNARNLAWMLTALLASMTVLSVAGTADARIGCGSNPPYSGSDYACTTGLGFADICLPVLGPFYYFWTGQCMPNHFGASGGGWSYAMTVE
jgi:hypothetical protein